MKKRGKRTRDELVRDNRALRQKLNKMNALIEETCDLAEEANGDPDTTLYQHAIGDRIKEIRATSKRLGASP